MTKNLDIDPDSIATIPIDKRAVLRADPDSIATIPIDKLAVLRADALAAITAHNAIDDWFSPEGRAACREMILACAAANAELERLAKNPKTRHGSWRTPFDVELMLLGYL